MKTRVHKTASDEDLSRAHTRALHSTGVFWFPSAIYGNIIPPWELQVPVSVCANVHQNESLRLIYEPKLLQSGAPWEIRHFFCAGSAARRLVRAEL